MKRTRFNNPMSLIVLGKKKKTPVGNKISVIGWLKGNLNMMGNIWVTSTLERARGTQRPCCPPRNIFSKMLLSHDMSWQKAQHKWINDPGHFSQKQQLSLVHCNTTPNDDLVITSQFHQRGVGRAISRVCFRCSKAVSINIDIHVPYSACLVSHCIAISDMKIKHTWQQHKM